MTKEQLFENIKRKKSFLCVGLDTDIKKIPRHLLNEDDPVFAFNKQIIDATKGLCVAYKPNIAFYESLGPKGWETLKKTIDYIPDDIFTIADAKRGDIGNTSELYARTFFETYDFNALTVAPYMGKDSVTPFLEYPDKWVVLLALTSNPGALDFQLTRANTQRLSIGRQQPGFPDNPESVKSGKMLFERVLEISEKWGSDENMMYVVGATRGELIKKVRKIIPDHFLLVPGIGAQGGSLSEVEEFAVNDQCGVLVNASRSIIYAGNDQDFADKAKEKTFQLQQAMEQILQNRKLI